MIIFQRNSNSHLISKSARRALNIVYNFAYPRVLNLNPDKIDIRISLIMIVLAFLT